MKFASTKSVQSRCGSKIGAVSVQFRCRGKNIVTAAPVSVRLATMQEAILLREIVA